MRRVFCLSSFFSSKRDYDKKEFAKTKICIWFSRLLFLDSDNNYFNSGLK